MSRTNASLDSKNSVRRKLTGPAGGRSENLWRGRMATKQKARSGKPALKAAKKPAAPKATAARRAAPAKPVAKKATASFRGGPQVAVRAPAASFALKFPLGNDARVVLDGLSRSVVDTFLTRTNKAPKDKSLEDRARVQVKKGGRWVGVPGVDAGGLAAAAMAATGDPAVSLPASGAAAASNPALAASTVAGFAASEAGFLGECPPGSRASLKVSCKACTGWPAADLPRWMRG